MCYDIRTKLETALRRAKREGNTELIAKLEEKLKPYQKEMYHASGFAHPEILIYTHEKPLEPQPYRWGLIPHWVKDTAARDQIWNKTINARGETIFEKPAFRDPAHRKRCLIYVDGFFEHHYHKRVAYPYLIQRKDREPLVLGGLYDDWVDPSTGELFHTFSVVTTKANALLHEIHNNPNAEEPRMPLVLHQEDEEAWLNETDIQKVRSLIRPLADDVLDAFTVRKLRGKESVGNTPQAIEEFHYKELDGPEEQQMSLFD